MRLDKFISNYSEFSRKEVKNMVKKRQIIMNGEVISSSDIKINPKYDKINVNGKDIFYKEIVTLAFYKPKGYLSSHKSEIYPSLFTMITAPYDHLDLKIAGRLDYDSEGLMILTTSGDLVHQITHPKKLIPKTYEATLNNVFNNTAQTKLLDGITIQETHQHSYLAKALSINYIDNLVTITIDEGKFHQVKKMFQAVGFDVTNLKRIQIGKLKLVLKPGAYKEIESKDIF